MDTVFTFKQAHIVCAAIATLTNWNELVNDSIPIEIGNKLKLIFQLVKEYNQDWYRHFIAARLGVSISQQNKIQYSECSSINEWSLIK